MLKAFNLSQAEPNKQELNLSEVEVSKQNQEQTQVAADLGKKLFPLVAATDSAGEILSVRSQKETIE